MGRQPKPLSRGDLLRRLRALEMRHRLLERRATAIEALAQDFAWQLSTLLEEVEAAIGHEFVDRVDGVPAEPEPVAAHRLVRQHVARQACARASSLERSQHADGSLWFRIDGGEEFKLPPALAALLSILARADLGQRTDDLVGWKSKEEVAKLLEMEVGNLMNQRALTQCVHRLRQELVLRAGVHPFLVQRHRRLGMRFALRCEGAGVPA